jgi:hypothetical protein
MPCQYYPPADLDDLEEEAESATPEQQKIGLQIVGDIFNRNQLVYALMGGMNFYLRGSGRTTQDVDLAVSKLQSLESTLDLLNEDDRWVTNCPLLTSSLILILVPLRTALPDRSAKCPGSAASLESLCSSAISKFRLI